MSSERQGFYSELGGEPLELGGWDALEHLAEDQKARQFAEQLEHASMYRQAFSTPAGKYVLQDLFTMFARQRVVQPGDDTHSPGIRQGQADIVHRILAMIEFANTGGGRPTGPGATTEE
jgi:hypothetical protein